MDYAKAEGATSDDVCGDIQRNDPPRCSQGVIRFARSGRHAHLRLHFSSTIQFVLSALIRSHYREQGYSDLVTTLGEAGFLILPKRPAAKMIDAVTPIVFRSLEIRAGTLRRPSFAVLLMLLVPPRRLHDVSAPRDHLCCIAELGITVSWPV